MKTDQKNKPAKFLSIQRQKYLNKKVSHSNSRSHKKNKKIAVSNFNAYTSRYKVLIDNSKLIHPKACMPSNLFF